jgi:hypothetical protein
MLVTLSISCAGGPTAAQQTPGADKDLVEAFDLKGGQFEKFKVGAVVEDVSVTPMKTVTQKKTVTVKKSKKLKIEKIASLEIEKDPYPADYPAELKALDEASKKIWLSYKPLVFQDEEIHFTVKYLGVTAGYVVLKTKGIVNIAGKQAFHYFAQLNSAAFYEMIYKVDDQIYTYLDRNTFLPIKYSLVQRESGQSIDDLQLFDAEQLKTFYWYKRIKKDKEKKEEDSAYVPKYFQDSFSALFFVRGLPLKLGDEYEFPVATRSKIWVLKVKVSAIEKIEIKGQEIEAIKIDAETRFPGILKKSGDINFWYSNDDQKRLLKFSAKIKIGSVAGELTEYKPGKKVE